MQLAGFSLMLVDLERVLPQIIQYVPYKDKDITVKLSAYNQPPFLFKKKQQDKTQTFFRYWTKVWHLSWTS